MNSKIHHWLLGVFAQWFPTPNTDITKLITEQNGWRSANNIFKWILVKEYFCILIQISLKFNFNGPIENKSVLVQIMAWYQTGDKPLPEPMMTKSHEYSQQIPHSWPLYHYRNVQNSAVIIASKFCIKANLMYELCFLCFSELTTIRSALEWLVLLSGAAWVVLSACRPCRPALVLCRIAVPTTTVQTV